MAQPDSIDRVVTQKQIQLARTQARPMKAHCTFTGLSETGEFILGKPTITDMEDFTRCMVTLAEQYPWAPLADWGARLEGQANTFDLAALPTILLKFEGLLIRARGKS